MDVLLRIEARGRRIDFGVATTRAERTAVLAQRFRVYQRHGYYRPGLTVDRDEYDGKAVYLAAALGKDRPTAVLARERSADRGDAGPPLQLSFAASVSVRAAGGGP